MLRIDATATISGIAMAGSVPKTNNRMISAPKPPIAASVSTLGPLPPPAALWSGSRPVRYALVPAGASCFSVLRVASSVGTPLKPCSPTGKISANVVCRSFDTYASLPVVK